MQHLENLSHLFSKDFVEHPLLESLAAGNLVLTSGKLVVCDPLTTTDMLPFTTVLPTGNFPVLLHRERESGCVAYAEIVFQAKNVESWEMATTAGQDLKTLQNEEIFGFPVESGMACFMDEETQQSLNILEQSLYQKKGQDFQGIYAEFFHEHFFEDNGAADQFAFLEPDAKKKGNIFAFEAGYGEGFFASYLGYDSDRQPVKLIAEFIEIKN